MTSHTLAADPSPTTLNERPEFKALLLCVSKPSEVSAELGKLLNSRFDWELFLGLATWHRILPLVARKLGNCSTIPESIREQLKSAQFSTAQRNLQISSDLSLLTDALAKRGIPTIAYKGVALSQYLYGNPAAREVRDIDLIIRSEDLSKATDCFHELGFVDRFSFSDSQREAMFAYWFEYGFTRNGINIDLHWRVVQRFVWPSLNMERVWKSLRPFTFCGRDLQMFTPDLMVATLCVHAGQDRWNYLHAFVDLCELLQKHPDLDWEAVQSWFGDSHARRTFHVSLYLMKTYLHADLPAAVWQTIVRDPHVAGIGDRIYRAVWSSSCDPAPSESDLREWLFVTRGEQSGDRVRFLSAALFRPTLFDFEMLGLPKPLRWFYFLLRPFRIANKRLKSKRASLENEAV